jgi:hypothetical protein
MEDTFAFRADRMPRRRIDPLAMKAAVAAALVFAVTGVFAKFVIDSERRSLARAEAPAHARDPDTVADIAPGFVDPEIDVPARSAAEMAIDAAVATLARDGSLAEAGPTELASLGTGLIFVDGPSTTDQVVSLASDGDNWAAAVMGASGTCFYAKVTADGVQTFGTGVECTGAAALHAAMPSWDV